MSVLSASRRLARPSTRSLSSLPSYVLYRNPRRASAAGMTALALGQAGFWGSAASAAQQAVDPVFGPTWTLAGFGMSAAFGALVAAYLRRSVAEIALVEQGTGVAVRVVPHGLAGFLGSPVVIPAGDLVAGPRRDDDGLRYWNFGLRNGWLYYIVDVKRGVVDKDGLRAVVRGGEHVVLFSHKRGAELVRERWQQWKKKEHDST